MSGGTAPTPYQPTNQAGADQSFQAGTSALASGGAQIQATSVPGYQALLSNVTTNPYYAGAQASANNVATSGAAFGNAGLSAAQGVQNLSTGLASYSPALASAGASDANALDALASGLGSYGTSLAQTGFDPQGALYNQTQQQTMDQVNAQNAMNGVAGSPFGAGLTNQAATNFNIDWQNNQQQRQLAAVAGLGTLDSTAAGIYGDASNVRDNTLSTIDANDATAGNLSTAASNIGTNALNVLSTTGAAPNNAYLSQQQSVQSALDSLVAGDTESYGLTQQSVTDDANYLNIGQQASAGALNAFNSQQAADNSFWSGIGGILGMGSGGGGTVGGDLLGFMGI